MRRLLVADRVLAPGETESDAVLIEGRRIAAVGRATEFRSGDLTEERFPGATIVPGLRDAHLHPVGHAASLMRPSLKQASNFDEVADILREAIRDLPEDAALTALRLDDESLAEGRLPDRDLLDRVAPDRPVLLVRYCGHVSVANSKALQLAGIDDNTPDPAGGSMDRDATGRPTGVLRETAADPVSQAIRSLAPPVATEDLLSAATGLASVGLTGIGAMAATTPGGWAGTRSEVDALVAAAPRLPITVGVMVIATDPVDLETAAERITSAGGHLRFTGLKVFSDGSLGGHTAAMHEGFADDPDERGTDRLDREWCLTMARTALGLGGVVAIHAIGDRANNGVLDLMETLIDEGAEPGMLRIEHASVLTEADIARFGRLGVTASVQPSFISSETEWLERRLGAERMRRTYAFRSLLQAGTPLAGGSDCPVEPPHPLWGMAAARDRHGLVIEEALGADEALHLFTTGAARSIGESALLRPGHAASITVLDANPLTATPEELRSASVLSTWVHGDEVPIPASTLVWED